MLVGSIGYFVSAIAFLTFFGILLTDKNKGYRKSLLFFAALSSSIWSLSMGYQSILEVDLILPQILEFVKGTAWLIFLFRMSSMTSAPTFSAIGQRNAIISVISLVVIMIFPVIYRYFLDSPFPLGSNFDFILATHLLLSVIGLVMLEQLLRNSRNEQRQVIKYMCLGLGGMLLYDFYMYSDALLYKRIDMDLWYARGYVDALVVPVLGMSIVRDPLWKPEIFVSRRVVFHTTALLASGLYLLLMGGAGYYVREYGGTWGHVGQAFLLFLTMLFLFIGLFSKRMRLFLKVLINKHFYPYKYDYREEWLRFIKTLSTSEANLNPNITTIRSIAQIIDSPGGMLWLRDDNDFYVCIETLEMPYIEIKESSESPISKFLEENEFVISLDEFKASPEVYNRLGFLKLPDWINEVSPWLIVPLIHAEKLMGFIVLDHAPAQKKHFNWEDSDLLKTAARQAAAFLAQREVADELAETKQFESFNKLSTYVIHDMKNLVTQLSLITSNAEKHKNNPLFMEDVIDTVCNSVNKMNKMMNVLQGKTDINVSKMVDIVQLLQELTSNRELSSSKPTPKLHCESKKFFVKGGRDQLLSIFGHLVQNAQDATQDDGIIDILESAEGNRVVIEIRDSGCGMDQNFIKSELFKPFKTTKGDSGMGIGAYETKEIITSLGGYIDVTSDLGKGTCFKVFLPGKSQ